MGIADVDVPPTIVDALEEDLAKNTGEIEVVESSTREANVFGLHGRLPRDVDDCSSAGSESCWGEMEDIGDDEIPEWGVLPPPPDSNMFATLADGLEEDLAVRDSEIVTQTDVAEIHSVEITNPIGRSFSSGG